MPVFSIITNGKSGVNTIYTSNVSAEDGEYVISPKIKKDTNKADSFEFMILPNHPYYNEFEKKKTYVYVKRDNKYIFRGRVSEIKTDIFRQRTVTCEGDLAYLADTVQFPNKETTTQKNTSSTKKHKRNTLYYVSGHETGHETGSTSKDTVKMTPKDYFRNVIAVHNGQVNSTGDNERTFTVGSITVSDTNNSENFERTSHQNTSSVISSDLLSVYGGILRTRYNATNNKTYIDWLDEYTDTTSQEIKFGVNLIDLDQEPPSDDAWSVLLPIGDENTTIASANNGNKFLIDQEALNKYGYIVHYHKFNNVKNSDELMGRAQTYLNTHAKVFPDNIVVKAIDLQLIGESDDPIELGDKVKVVSTPHGLDTTMACIKMELDIQNPENNSYTIGTIMPPDKEKKKESLSEKQSSSSKSSSRGIGNNRNDIEGLRGDVDAASNNINVNAENIAVNALNIAVNAENIAVVAKNIAIAAEQIDVQAQNITVALGNEADDLYGKIEASAEGIKSTFTDNTTGLSSYFSQKAGEITAAISNADGSISGKITMTEESLTTEYNKKIYGENGIVADYQSKIQQTATSLTSDYTAKISSANEEITAAYEGKIQQTATSLTSDYTAKISTAKDEITSEYEGKIEQTASSLTSDYTAKITNAKTDITTEYESKIEQTASSINTEVSKKVGKTEIVSSINQTAETIKISASRIDLSGYVTASQLETTNANITNLTNGTTTATKIVATSAKVTTGTFEIGDSSNTSTKLKYHGTEYYSLTVSMPGVTGSFDALGYYYNNTTRKYETSFSLAHSHSVTTNTDGTITIGGSVATNATGRSFKIADTKAYKDGVSAATNAVTVDSVGLNTKDYTTSGIGTAQTDKTPIWFSSPKTFYARLRAEASNSKHREASITIDATKAYDAGAASVTMSSVFLNTEDYSSGIGDSSSEKKAMYFTSPKTFYVHVKARATNGKTGTNTILVNAEKAYNKGNSDGVASVAVSTIERKPGADDTYGVNDSHDTRIHVRATASNGDTKDENFIVSGTSAYNAGVSAVDVTSIIRKPGADDTYGVNNSHDTRIHVRAAASNGHSKDENFIVSGTSAYNAGVSAVDFTGIGLNTTDYPTYWLIGDGSNSTSPIWYEESTKKFHVHIRADLSNSKSKKSDVDVDATKAYNHGYGDGHDRGVIDGQASVGPDNVTITNVVVNTSTKNASMTVSVNGGAGKTKRVSGVTVK